jgi:hypothetical protein
MSPDLSKRPAVVACLLGAGLLLAATPKASAGEKAVITPPSKAKSADRLQPPKSDLPFRPLDGSSSLGGVIDGGGGPALPTVEPATPDPKTQREILERLDRRRNFLLDRSSTETQFDNTLLESGVRSNEEDLLLTPRKPQTVLEKQLRKGSSLSQDEKPAKPTEFRSRIDDDGEDDNETGNLDLTGLGTASRSRVDKLKLGEFPTSHPTQKTLLVEDALQPSGTGFDGGTIEDLRSSMATAGGRGFALDALSRERLERYQQLSGDVESTRRGFGASAAELGKPRELRSEAAQSLYAPAPLEELTPTKGLATTADSAELPGGRSNPFATGPVATGIPGFSPTTPLAPPTPSPAAVLLRQPRPEPPRFRP